MINISEMLPLHWEAVKKIYEEGLATGNASFETVAPAWQHWDDTHVKVCRLIAINENGVCGWAALSPVSTRKVYAGVAELSIYIAAAARGKHIGSLLLAELVRQSEQHGYWTLQAGIFPENLASIAIHTRNGFRVVGYREKIGRMGDSWRDNIYMERRSRVVGFH